MGSLLHFTYFVGRALVPDTIISKRFARITFIGNTLKQVMIITVLMQADFYPAIHLNLDAA